MYKRKGFKTTYDLIEFLNQEEINKENIVSVIKNDDSNEYWIYELIYIKEGESK